MSKPPWTPDQTKRKDQAEQGQCVVANMHGGIDRALITWAKADDRFVQIDRRTAYGNPFIIPRDGNRAEVVAKFAASYQPPQDTTLLRGKVLGCWCHPEPCHGHIIAEAVNAPLKLEEPT